MRDQPTPEQTPERIAEIQRTLRPFINHRADCTFGQSNPDGDYCSCGVRGAITKANTLAAELVAQVDALTATLAHLTQERDTAITERDSRRRDYDHITETLHAADEATGFWRDKASELHKRAEQAEATLARVKALRRYDLGVAEGKVVLAEDLDAALVDPAVSSSTETKT